MTETTMQTKPLTQAQLLQLVAETTRLTKAQVSDVFIAMNDVIAVQLSASGPGSIKLPGNTIKLRRAVKPATEAGERPHPFKPGEVMQVKAKSESIAVKVNVLKSLKQMVN